MNTLYSDLVTAPPLIPTEYQKQLMLDLESSGNVFIFTPPSRRCGTSVVTSNFSATRLCKSVLADRYSKIVLLADHHSHVKMMGRDVLSVLKAAVPCFRDIAHLILNNKVVTGGIDTHSIQGLRADYIFYESIIQRSDLRTREVVQKLQAQSGNSCKIVIQLVATR